MDEYIKLGDVLRVFAQKQQQILGYDRYYYLSPDKKDEYDLYTILVDDIEKIPVADVVSQGVFDQVKWERDTALTTLEEHGIGLAQKVDVIEIPKSGIGDLSDGYHTFNELYHHRAILFSVICNLFPDKAWKSKMHDDETMFDGMFIVGIETPQGQATYHYDIEPYWNMFNVKELDKAPKWDGHTPQEAIERISNLTIISRSEN